MRRAALATDGLRLMIILAGAALVVVILDHALPGGAPRSLMNFSGWLWVAALVAGVATAAWRMVRLRPTAPFAARLLEKLTAIRHNRLVNYVYLAAEAHPALEAAERDIGHVLRDEPLRGAARLAGEPRLLAPLLGVIACWLMFAAITPKPITPSLARMFGADLDAPTATQLRLIAPAADAVIYQGDILTIEVELSGRPVRDVTFTRSARNVSAKHTGEPGDVMAHPMLRVAQGDNGGERRQLSLAPHETSTSFEYRITAGDAVLHGAIDPLPLPAIDEFILRVHPPPHVGEPSSVVREGDVSAWAESTADIELYANSALQDAALVIEHAVRAVTRLRTDPAAPRVARLTTRLRESGAFWIEFRDVNGRPGRTTPRRLILRPDHPPEVTIVRPSAEETPTGELDLTQIAAIHVMARDDVRLSSLVLVLDRRGVTERIALRSAAQLTAQREAALSLASDFFPVREGETVRAWFEAADNHVDFNGTPAPQTARSRTLTLIRSRPPPPPDDPLRGMEGVPADRSPDDSDNGEMVESTRAAAAEDIDEGVTGGPTVRTPDDFRNGDENDPFGELPIRNTPEAGRSRGDDDLTDALREFIERHGDTVRRLRDEESENGQPYDAARDDAPELPPSDSAFDQPESESPRLERTADEAAEPTPTDSEPSRPDDPGDMASESETPQPVERSDREPRQEPDGRPQSDEHSASQPANEAFENEEETPEAGEIAQTDENAATDESESPDEPGNNDAQGENGADDAPQTDAASDAVSQAGESAEVNDSNAPNGSGDSPQADDAQDQPAADPGSAPPPQDSSTPTGSSGGPTPGGAMNTPEGDSPSVDSAGHADSEGSDSDAPGVPVAPGDSLSQTASDQTSDGLPTGMAEQLAHVVDLLNQSPEELDRTLEELGLGDDERRDFVESIERLRMLSHEAGVFGPLHKFTPGESSADEVLTGRVAIQTESDDPDRAPNPAVIRAPREQRIAAELQALLDAYYAALASESSD